MGFELEKVILKVISKSCSVSHNILTHNQVNRRMHAWLLSRHIGILIWYDNIRTNHVIEEVNIAVVQILATVG